MDEILQPKDTESVKGFLKRDPTVYCLREVHLSFKDKDWEERDGKRYFNQIVNQKKARKATLISDKIDFKLKTVTRDKEDH